MGDDAAKINPDYTFFVVKSKRCVGATPLKDSQSIEILIQASLQTQFARLYSSLVCFPCETRINDSTLMALEAY